MRYHAKVTKDGKHLLVEFPDAPGCQTFAETEDELRVAAKEALEGWLESFLVEGDAPPQPKSFRGENDEPLRPKAKGRTRELRTWFVDVDLRLSVAVQLRWARQRAGISQAELAERAGVTQQQIAKLERPRANPSLGTLSKIAQALGERVEFAFLATDISTKKQPRKLARVTEFATTNVQGKRERSATTIANANANLQLRPIAVTKPRRTLHRGREPLAN